MTSSVIAEKLGVTRQRVRQLIVRLHALGRIAFGDPGDPFWIVMRADDKSLKEGVETAVGDSQRIAQLTTAVFTAAFEPVKKRIEAVQNAAHP